MFQIHRGAADMKPMTDEHLTILRRHMVEVIGIHADDAVEISAKTGLNVIEALEAILASPQFLFRVEEVPARVLREQLPREK